MEQVLFNMLKQAGVVFLLLQSLVHVSSVIATQFNFDVSVSF
ncbi:hypothetical protein [Neisseria sp.]